MSGFNDGPMIKPGQLHDPIGSCGKRPRRRTYWEKWDRCRCKCGADRVRGECDRCSDIRAAIERYWKAQMVLSVKQASGAAHGAESGSNVHTAMMSRLEENT